MGSDSLQLACQYLLEAKSVVCLTGAGVSAESGISTFRDPESGHWAKFDPEVLASQHGFQQDPGLVWRWYMERLFSSTTQAEPNPGHYSLAKMESELHKRNGSFMLVTQNVDDLHEQAGSQNVCHLHGNISSFFCNSCRRDHILDAHDKRAEMPPLCLLCGGYIRPGVVWFGEQLPVAEIESAWDASQRCDVMLIVGTSGVVYPAAHLPMVAKQAGAKLIDINPEHGATASMADLFLQGPSGDILPQLLEMLHW